LDSVKKIKDKRGSGVGLLKFGEKTGKDPVRNLVMLETSCGPISELEIYFCLFVNAELVEVVFV
jgi:hypothetical protein